jgi:nucleotide-binding universal stress UspA family protein
MFREILIGVKEDGPVDELVELAESVAAQGASIHLATFVRVGNDGDERIRADRVEAHLAPAVAGLEGRGFVAGCSVAFMAALAGSELVRLAEQRDADLIVVGLVKRSRVGKALLGGDAQSVLLGASCPVLCARFTD